MVAPPSMLDKKPNMGAHLQTFPYPMVPNLFLNSNSLMVIWHSQILSFQKRDKPKKNKQKTSNFLLPWQYAKSQPNQTWQDDRGGTLHFGRSKTCSPLTHNFATRGR